MAARRVLIVDDDPLIRGMVREFLGISEYEVHEAGEGTEGLAKAEALRPAIILLDLMMPGRDGYAVCQALMLNPKTQGIPVVILTASNDVKLNRKAYAAGALACITKPFRREALVAVLEAVLVHLGRRESVSAGGIADCG